MKPWLHMLDRGRTWGSLAIDASHYGITRYRLVVFPPGIAPDERALLRIWRTWPLWGAVAFLGAEIWLNHALASNVALAISVALVLGGGAVAMALAGATRGRVRTRTVTLMRGFDDPETLSAFRELEELAELLLDADDRLARGEITAVDHESVVWQVYERLGSTQGLTGQRRDPGSR